MTTIYVAMIDDRRDDTKCELFTDPAPEVERADGELLYLGVWSVEGDYAWVVAKELHE